MKFGSVFANGVLILSSLTLAACITTPKGVGDYDVGYKQRGEASWYGDAFHGKLTASGEIYDQHEFTAAHRMLPLGTLVRVTNARNGRSVDVVINDRGPFIAGRIIDLSFAAAKRLGIIHGGTAPVFLEVLKEPEALEDLSIEEQHVLTAFRGALQLEPGSYYGDTWFVPGGNASSVTRWRPLGDVRDERRSRRLSALIADEAPYPLPLQDQELIS
jgi:3D (Asp-Asp-Asp) domain-containing protein